MCLVSLVQNTTLRQFEREPKTEKAAGSGASDSPSSCSTPSPPKCQMRNKISEVGVQ
jgi:hypothetical protein